MSPFNTIVVGFKEVWSHKFRSLLTMLGIILGVASLVGMAAIIRGMENAIKSKRVTYDLARQMPGATEISTSAFGDQVIAGMKS